MPKILSFSSFGSGTGKDTAVDYVCERHGFIRFAWASILRQVVAKDFPDAPGHYRDGSLVYVAPDKIWEDASGFTQALIDYHDHEGVTERGKDVLKKLSQQDPDIVVLATRLVSQFNALRELDATMVLIRGVHRRGVRELDECLLHHKFDVKVDNDGTVEDFHQKLDEIVVKRSDLQL